MTSELLFANDQISVILELQQYRLTAIKKAAFRLADRCSTLLAAADEERVQVSFLFKAGRTEAYARETVRLYLNELLDQELREHVAEETAPIRALILAHAFSKADLIKRD